VFLIVRVIKAKNRSDNNGGSGSPTSLHNILMGATNSIMTIQKQENRQIFTKTSLDKLHIAPIKDSRILGESKNF
jgi:hypothetical protein